MKIYHSCAVPGPQSDRTSPIVATVHFSRFCNRTRPNYSQNEPTLREANYGLLTPKNGDARALHMTIHTSRARLGTAEKVHARHPRHSLWLVHEQVDVNGACQPHSMQHPCAQSRSRTSATVARAVIFTRRGCAHTCSIFSGRCEIAAVDDHASSHRGAHT